MLLFSSSADTLWSSISSSHASSVVIRLAGKAGAVILFVFGIEQQSVQELVRPALFMHNISVLQDVIHMLQVCSPRRTGYFTYTPSCARTRVSINVVLPSDLESSTVSFLGHAFTASHVFTGLPDSSKRWIVTVSR